MSTPENQAFWLIKFAPFRTSWAEIVKRGTFTMRGVRSIQARNNLAVMRLGDPVLFYHSQQECAIVGLMEVSREAYPDPTSADSQWLTCDFTPLRTLPHPVTLAELKTDPEMTAVPLIRQPRLSVVALTSSQFAVILKKASDWGRTLS
jgi:predicted RNA-binding protein with PUA-like domain